MYFFLCPCQHISTLSKVVSLSWKDLTKHLFLLWCFVVLVILFYFFFNNIYIFFPFFLTEHSSSFSVYQERGKRRSWDRR